MPFLCLVLVVVSLCACPPPVRLTQQGSKQRLASSQSSAADHAFAAAIQASATKSYQERIKALLAVRDAYPETTAGQEALYHAGVLAFKADDYTEALQWLNQFIFANPLSPKGNDARFKVGLAAVQLGVWHEARQTLAAVVNSLSGADRRRAKEGLARAIAAITRRSEPLRIALERVNAARLERDVQQALADLELVLDAKTDFRAIVEALENLSPSNPAWPLLTYKLMRIYYHVRDFVRFKERLTDLSRKAPASAWTKKARRLSDLMSRNVPVRPQAVGALLPLSGKYKAFGEAALRGMRLALQDSEVELLVRDTQGDAEHTGKLVEGLVYREGVIAIIGPLLTENTRRAALVAEKLRVPIITMSQAPQVTAIGPHVFRSMVTNTQQAEALAEYSMSSLGYKKFAILHPNTPFGVELADRFWGAIESRGGEIRGIESYGYGQKTFTEETQKLVGRYYLNERWDYLAQLKEIRSKALNDFHHRKAVDRMKAKLEPIVDFDALLIPDGWQQVSLIAPALAVQDIITNACDKKDYERIRKTTGKSFLKTVTLLGPSTWNSPKGASGTSMLVERGGKYVQCSVFVGIFFEESKRRATHAFVSAFRDMHGTATITLLDVVGYDTAVLVRNIIERMRPMSRETFRAQLTALRQFEGTTSIISFDSNREAKRKLFLLNITPQGIQEVPAAHGVLPPPVQ